MTDVDWAALQAPIEAKYIKQVNKGYGDRSYVDAPALMQRLDDVVGAGNWMESTTIEWEDGVPTAICTLRIHVGDVWVEKTGIGGPNNVGRSTSDSGRQHKKGDKWYDAKDGKLYVEDDEPAKSAASDAFRRACRKWGIGRELWMPETATQAPQASSTASAAPKRGGDTPKCGIEGCGGVGVVRKSGDNEFWGCSNYREKGCKGKFPKYGEEEQQSLADAQPPETNGASDEPADTGEEQAKKDLVLACGMEFKRLGKTTLASQVMVFRPWAKEAGIADIPDNWQDLTVDGLMALADALGEMGAAP